MVAIDRLNLVRRNRKEIMHSGVCMYIKDTVPFSVSEDLADDFLEVLWLDLRPSQLPRGVNNIFVGVIYHPPKAQNSEMLAYLIKCLSAIESRYSNCGKTLLGDVNKLDTTRLKSNYNLKQIVHFPTRGRNTLHQILTNLSDYYDPAVERPAFGLSDHCSIAVQPKERYRNSENKATVKSRDLRPSVRLAIRSYLEQVDITALISSVKSCEEKSTLLQTIVQTGLDFVAPLKTKIIHNTEPPWINQNLKSPIKRRQRALNLGDQEKFRRLRNRVNRKRKSCRSKYYDRNEEHLKNCSPSQWWTEVKKLSGMSKGSGAKENIIESLTRLNNGDAGVTTDADLANLVNDAFFSPMKDFQPLTKKPTLDSNLSSESTLIVTAASVFKKPSAINPIKAQRPDGIPGWLLKEDADLLTNPVQDILNTSYKEDRLPSVWKEANIIPIPKKRPIFDINKHFRPISLTPLLSKLAEEYVVEMFVKPAVPAKIDSQQFGTIPNSSATHALIDMTHSWLNSTDGNTTRVVLFDFRKAFDLIDHTILVKKLCSYSLPSQVLSWIVDFFKIENRE